MKIDLYGFPLSLTDFKEYASINGVRILRIVDYTLRNTVIFQLKGDCTFYEIPMDEPVNLQWVINGD